MQTEVLIFHPKQTPTEDSSQSASFQTERETGLLTIVVRDDARRTAQYIAAKYLHNRDDARSRVQYITAKYLHDTDNQNWKTLFLDTIPDEFPLQTNQEELESFLATTLKLANSEQALTATDSDDLWTLQAALWHRQRKHRSTVICSTKLAIALQLLKFRTHPDLTNFRQSSQFKKLNSRAQTIKRNIDATIDHKTTHFLARQRVYKELSLSPKIEDELSDYLPDIGTAPVEVILPRDAIILKQPDIEWEADADGNIELSFVSNVIIREAEVSYNVTRQELRQIDRALRNTADEVDFDLFTVHALWRAQGTVTASIDLPVRIFLDTTSCLTIVHNAIKETPLKIKMYFDSIEESAT